MNPAQTLLQTAIGLASGIQGTLAPAMERSPERDIALTLLAERAGETGWTAAALREAAGPEADLLFPGGPVEMVEAWCDLADRTMLDRAYDLEETRLSRRVRATILDRLSSQTPYREANRRALAVLAQPCAGRAMARSLTRTTNAIWQAAEDEAAGLTWVTKCLSLASIYAATLLFWLSRGQDEAAVAAFLDRRLAVLARVGRLKQRLLSKLPGRRTASA